MKQSRPNRFFFITIFFIVLSVVSWRWDGQTAVASSSHTPADKLTTAWELTQQSNTYQFDTHLEQISYPILALNNVGRQPQTDHIYLSGHRNQAEALLQMTLWQQARGDANNGLAVRSQNGQTFLRNKMGEWEKHDAFSQLLTSDPLIFIQTASHIEAAGTDTRQLGELTLHYEKYRFDLDTSIYARLMRQQLEAQMAHYGRLPAGMTLDTPDVYRQMSGTGQIWLDERGLPRRLELTLEIPQQTNQGRVTAHITTDLSGFDEERVAQTAVPFWQSPQTWVMVRQSAVMNQIQVGLTVSLWLLVGLGFLLLTLTYWRTYRFYVAVVLVIITSMLTTPFLQVTHAHAFYSKVHVAQEASQHQQAVAQAEADLHADLKHVDWNPQQNPLAAVPALMATNTLTDTTDTDGDGLMDIDEERWGTCPYLGAFTGCTEVVDATDSDGDGLNDGVEVHELGTDPNNADSDNDSIADNLEISGFEYGGQTWYLNPTEADSNKDGLVDGLECRVRTAVIPANFNPLGTCPDTDMDGEPDVFDDDNDGDGVHDKIDMSPFSASDGYFDKTNPLNLQFDNLALDKPVFVDIQIQPQTTSNLNLYNHHVLDWPSLDGEGQIQRMLDTTFATTQNQELKSNSANAANGDIRLVPMLEITMPYTDEHYANLPITTTAPLTRTLGEPVENWLDTAQMDAMGITVNDLTLAEGDLTAYLPVTQVKDDYGTPQAFAARMLYYPSQGANGRADWGIAHEYRLIWLVQMITDQCPEGYEDVREEVGGVMSYTCENPQTGATTIREDVLTVGHIYPETWQLTGLQVNEEHDFDLAIVYEDPTQDPDFTADDQLLVASWNLNTGFLLGRDCDSQDGNGVCQGDGNRDVTVENLPTAVSSWLTDTNYLQVDTYLNYEHGAYLAQIIGTEVEPLLNTTFGNYTNTIPTLLYAHDHTNRSLNLDSLTNNSSAGLITTTNSIYQFDLKPNEVVEQVKSSMSWTPYQYVNGSWQAADIESYLARLDLTLQTSDFFQPADESETAVQEAQLRRNWLQLYYTALWQGVSSVTESSEVALYARANDPDLPDNVYDPLLTPGTGFGATLLAVAAFQFLGTYLTQGKLAQAPFVQLSSQSVSNTTFAVGYGLAVGTAWVGLALLLAGAATGDKTLVRAGRIILAVVTLTVGTVYALNAMIGIVNTLQQTATSLDTATSYQAVGPAGLAISLGLIWGIFLFQASNMNEVQRSVAASLAIASSLMVIFLFMLSLMGLGILGILLALVDAIFVLLDKKGPSQYVVEFIAGLLYDIDLSVTNLESSDRLEIQLHDVGFVDAEQGFRVGNSLVITMGITNTIKYHRDLADEEEKVAKRNVFEYILQTEQLPHHDDLPYWDDTATDQWTPLSGRKLRTTSENTIEVLIIEEGVNQSLEVYYTESLRSGYRTCWKIPTQFGTTIDICKWKDFDDSIHYPLAETLVFDIFPATVTEFAGMNWSDNVDVALPAQVDRDADGVADRFGTDPDTNRTRGFDTDQDGLGDAYEISNGYLPTIADGDDDGLNDAEELIWGTNPFLQDTDGDGLNDRIEVIEGWLIVSQGQLVRVWSDPLVVDEDDDGLSDLEEFIFGFHPQVPTDPSLISQLVQFDNLGVTEVGSPELWLQFEDDATSTTFYDSAGEGHHASCVAGTCPIVNMNGRYAQAVQFDGTDDYLEVPFILDPAQTPFTVATWFNVSNHEFGPSLIQQLDGSGVGRTWLRVMPNGELQTFLGNSALTSSTTVLTNSWQHAAVTYDGSTVRLYLNGVLENSANRTAEASDGALWLGRHKFIANAFLHGSLDDVVVVDDALGGGEIVDLMNGRFNPNDNLLAPNATLRYQTTVTNTSSTTASGFLVAENSYFEPELRYPAAAFSFEPDQRRAFFANSTGEENNAICLDNLTCPTAGVSGRHSNGIRFDGFNDSIILPAITIDQSYAFNLSFWIHPFSFPTGSERMMLIDTDSEDTGALDMYLNSSGNIVWDIVGDPQSPRVDSRTLNTTGWTHVSLNDIYQLYINGTPAFVGTDETLDIQIGPGRLGSNITGDELFQGKLDELAYFNLSQSDRINAIMNGNYGDNNKLLYKFTELISYDGTTFYDSQTSANHATCGGNTCPVLTQNGAGYSGRAVAFDGVDDYLTQPGGNFNANETTVSLYVNPASYPASGEVAYLYDGNAVGSGTTFTFDLYLDENGHLTVDYGSGSYTYDDHAPLSLNSWSKIEVVYDRLSSPWRYHIYLEIDDDRGGAFNYADVCDDPSTSACVRTARVSSGRIGNNLAGTAPFAGLLDQLNLKVSVIDFDPPSVNLGYDNLANERRSATCADVFTCPSKANGRYGSGLSLDGFDDYLTLNPLVNPAIEPFTAAMWFTTDGYSNEPIFLQQADGTGTGRTWLGIRSDGRLYSYLGGSYLNGATTILTDTWHHAAVTYDGTQLRLYLDGVEEASETRTMEASDGELILGRHKSFLNQHVSGQLDELVILPTAVTTHQIQLLMNSQWPMIEIPAEFEPFSASALTSQQVSGLASVSPYATTSQHRFDQEVEAALELQAQINYPVIDDNSADLEIFIPFEDGPGSTIFDNLIGYAGAPLPEDREAICLGISCPTAGLRGQVGRAAYFDGLDDYLLLDTNAMGTSGPNNIYALSVWVNAQQGTILDIDQSNVGVADTVEIDMNRILTNRNDTIQTLSYDAPRNEWFHLVVTIDTNDQGTVYINGIPVISGTLLPMERDYIDQFVIGMNQSGQDPLLGYLDDLRIYGTPLTQADVTTLYETSAPLLRFEFDEDTAATVFLDNSINQYVGRPRQEQCATLTLDMLTVNSLSSPSATPFVSLNETRLWQQTGLVASDVVLPAVASLLCGNQTLQLGLMVNGTVVLSETAVINHQAPGFNSQTAVGNGHSITLNWTVGNEPIYQQSPAPGTQGRIGNGALFDGNSYIKLEDATEPASLTNNFTIMGWVRPQAVNAGIQWLFGTGNKASVNGYHFALDNDRLLFKTNGEETYLSNVTLEPDRWQHVAVVFDSSYDAHFYLDGVHQQTIAGSSPTRLNTDDPLYIGMRQNINGQFIDPFTGLLDELAVYGRTLSEAELYGIYLRELRWYRDKTTTYLTIDTDSPTIDLLSDASYWPDGYIQLAVATTDATSAVTLLDFGLKAPNATDFSWQGAPTCADSSAAWCPYFDSTQLGGEGLYELQFRAVDAVGNETISPVYTFYVDGTAPTAVSSYTNQWLQPASQADAELSWTFTLSGTLADPDLVAVPVVAGSGVVTESVLVQLVDGLDGSLSDPPQSATINGNSWQVDYQMNGVRPQGTYSITLSMADLVGNAQTVTVGTITLDERPPQVDLYTWSLPSEVISQTWVISGTAHDAPDWGGSVVEHHFEEPVGATNFYNTGTSQYYTLTHSTCSACPTAGQPALFGNGVLFDGGDDQIDIPYVFDPNSTAFSASVWFNLSNLNDTRTLLQQLDGNGIGRTWLAIESSHSKLQTYLGGTALLGTTTVTAGDWNHAAVTYDGTTVRLYLNGRLEASEERTIESTNGAMRLGVNKTSTSRFLGLMDEFTLYDRFLSAQEVYALAQQGAVGVTAVDIAITPASFVTPTAPLSLLPAHTLVVNDNKWQHTLPAGLQGFYDIQLNGVDSFGNQSRDNMVWRGLIDTVPPVVSASGQHLWQNNTPVTEYTFTFTDFILDDTSYSQPCGSGDLVSLTYDDATLPQDGLPYEVTATCQVVGHDTSFELTVCDSVGLCTTQTVAPTAAHLLSITAVNPTSAQLQWTQPSGYCGYAVHQNNSPYFTPTPSTELATVGGAVNLYDLLGGLNNTAFYLLQADGCGGGTAVSNEVGVFTFDLIAGD